MTDASESFMCHNYCMYVFEIDYVSRIMNIDEYLREEVCQRDVFVPMRFLKGKRQRQMTPAVYMQSSDVDLQYLPTHLSSLLRIMMTSHT